VRCWGCIPFLFFATGLPRWVAAAYPARTFHVSSRLVWRYTHLPACESLAVCLSIWLTDPRTERPPARATIQSVLATARRMRTSAVGRGFRAVEGVWVWEWVGGWGWVDRRIRLGALVVGISFETCCEG